MLQSWNPSGFSVFVGEPVDPHQTESRERLARYVVKPAVALDRMLYNPDTCRVTVRSTKRGEQRELTAPDFLADLAVHIPDLGEQTVRYYGRASNRARGERRKAQTEPSGTSAPVPGPPAPDPGPPAPVPGPPAPATVPATPVPRGRKAF
ncbi:MAG: transposase, partial [Candidatus Xenobia bacterium]